MRLRQGIAAGVAGVAAAAVVAACGVDTKDAGTPTAPAPEGATVTSPVRRSTVPLPPAPENTVRLDALRGGLGGDASTRFLSRSSINVALIRAAEDQSFADLCAGRVDVIEVARLPTDDEITACRERGVDLSEPLQLGADGVVIATKNEADVGGDCVTVQQARDLFRAGSAYTSWSQLGFFDLPITATGREDGSSNFEFFGQVVLGLPDPSLADVRADYVVRRTDRAEREEVTGVHRLRAADARIARYVAGLRRQTQARRQRQIDAAIRAADRRTIAAIERENRARARRHVTLSALQALALERRNRLRVERAKRAAATAVGRRFDAELRDRGRRFGRGVLAEAEAPGVVGGFRFSYYELFEDELRPLEIDYGVAVTASGQPVTLEDLSESDRRRVEQATTTPTQTQTVPAVGTTPEETETTPDGETTATVPTSRAIPDLPASRLPKKTKDGDEIYPGPNCVFPSQVTITSGAYPFSRRLFAFTSRQALGRAEVVEFLEFVLSNARELATDNRLVPITDAQLAKEIAILRNRGHTPSPRAQQPSRTTTTPTTTTTTPATPEGGSGIPGVSNRGG
jgi:hypothetical protein